MPKNTFRHSVIRQARAVADTCLASATRVNVLGRECGHLARKIDHNFNVKLRQCEKLRSLGFAAERISK